MDGGTEDGLMNVLPSGPACTAIPRALPCASVAHVQYQAPVTGREVRSCSERSTAARFLIGWLK